MRSILRIARRYKLLQRDAIPRGETILEFNDQKADMFNDRYRVRNQQFPIVDEDPVGVSAPLGWHRVQLGKHRTIAVVNGGTAGGTRDEIVQAFRNPSDPLRIVVARTNCMARDLTLVSADAVARWSPTHSLEVYE